MNDNRGEMMKCVNFLVHLAPITRLSKSVLKTNFLLRQEVALTDEDTRIQILCETVRCKFSPNHPRTCRNCTLSEQNGTLVSGRTKAQSTKRVGNTINGRTNMVDSLDILLPGTNSMAATNPRDEASEVSHITLIFKETIPIKASEAGLSRGKRLGKDRNTSIGLDLPGATGFPGRERARVSAGRVRFKNRFEPEPDGTEHQVQVQGSFPAPAPNVRFSVRAAKERSNPEPNSNLKIEKRSWFLEDYGTAWGGTQGPIAANLDLYICLRLGANSDLIWGERRVTAHQTLVPLTPWDCSAHFRDDSIVLQWN
ncbi:hypothetical protein FB451DRAFT_1173290 [Mycena latifolia]|nr:hypothetical protein FB451DRAFT_1173290 [Mycena latifolia]